MGKQDGGGWNRATWGAVMLLAAASAMGNANAAGTQPGAPFGAQPSALKLLAAGKSHALNGASSAPEAGVFTLPADFPATAPLRMRLDRQGSSLLELIGEVRGLRRGVGFDWGLPEAGNLHMNLYSGRDGFGRGRRWNLGGMADDVGPGFTPHAWSIGASMDLVRFRSHTGQELPHARISFAPQLVLDVDRLTGLRSHCDLLIQHQMWRSADGRAADQERVVQMTLNWKF